MKHADLETTYAALAEQIDAVGPDNTQVFLAKLVLLLAQKNGDLAEVKNCIDSAAASLMRAP